MELNQNTVVALMVSKYNNIYKYISTQFGGASRQC